MDDTNDWPGSAWRTAFREEATADTMEAAVRCAAIELGRLERLGVFVPSSAEDLVQKLLAATIAGAIAWTPGMVSLRAHLRDKIRLFGRRARRGQRRSETKAAGEVSLDQLSIDDPTWEHPALSGEDLGERVVLCDLARRAEVELWHLAAADPAALRVLAAMTGGDYAADDIATATGLTERTVRNARRRLRTLASRLSPPLRSAIRAELGRELEPMVPVTRRLP